MSHSTAEAGELSPRDPVEGRGHRQVAPVEGKTANTPRLGPVSTSRHRIAELARQALGMAVAIAWLPGPAGTRRRVAKPSVEEPDAAEPARPDLWGARVSNDPGLPDHGVRVFTAEDGWVWTFAAVAHWNAECVGWHVCKVGSRFAALEPIAQGLGRRYGSVEADVARGLALRMDHGSQYLSDHFLKPGPLLGHPPQLRLA